MFTFLRKSMFYGMDILKGGLIRNHILDLINFNENPELQHKIISARLKRLLVHASNTTKYYKAYNGTANLNEYQVVTKNHIQRSECQFLSSKYPKTKLTERKTSGSYGTPLCVYFSREKLARYYAELIYYNKYAGLDIGEKYLNITTTPKRIIEKRMKNVVIINPAKMDYHWCEETINHIAANKDTIIIGFPSVLYALSKFVFSDYSGNNKIRVKGIVTIAEPLNACIKNTIEDVFQCPVFNRYATMETGVIGHSTRNDNNIFINRSSYIIELLAFDSDRAINEGEDGRIIITDLFSYGMPLVRYETGDTAMLVSKNDYGAICIKNPEGRIIETIFATNGSKISWAVIYDIMTQISDVFQYQFRQTGEKNYQMYIITSSGYSRDSEQHLYNKLRDTLGNDAILELCYVDSIPALPSGKRPMIINEYKANRFVAM
jgi:phenylacetate-CoA ligase